LKISAPHAERNKMKKFLLTLSVILFSQHLQSAMPPREEINNATIELSEIDHEVIITGHCTLDHDLKIISPHGRLIIVQGAQLDVISPSTYEWTEENASVALLNNWLTEHALIVSCRNRNSICFWKGATINIYGAVIFDFEKGLGSYFKGIIRLTEKSLFNVAFAHTLKERFNLCCCLSGIEQKIEEIFGSPKNVGIEELIVKGNANTSPIANSGDHLSQTNPRADVTFFEWSKFRAG
jgi:hypothetical protein